MVDHSKTSTENGKKNTGKTEPDFGPEEAVQILNKALAICQAAGLPVYQTPIYDGGEEAAGVIIHQAKWEGGSLKYTGKPAKYTGKSDASTGSQEGEPA